jgi:beta-catenin-like protein 1
LTQDETEMAENLFDCLCSCLLEGENKEKFLEAEGVELMTIMTKLVLFQNNNNKK